jgi:hypothetical protein
LNKNLPSGFQIGRQLLTGCNLQDMTTVAIIGKVPERTMHFPECNETETWGTKLSCYVCFFVHKKTHIKVYTQKTHIT